MIVKTWLGLFTLLVTLVGAAHAQPANDFDAPAERELVRLVNDARQKAGLQPLAVDERLTQAARAHSQLLAQHGNLSHQYPGEPPLVERLAATGLRFDWSAENVALDSGTPADAHRGLMNSPPHRANILNSNLNAIGVGVVRQGGLIYVTEDFARRGRDYSAKQAEDLAAATFVKLRHQRGLAPLAKDEPPALRDAACNMAREGGLDRPLPPQAGARFVVRYTEPEPDKLPSEAARLASNPTLKRFAVGACYDTSEKYPGGTWWMVMVFY